MNIVSMVLQYLGPALIGKLASGSGVSQTVTEKLVKAAVPTILGALLGKSSKSDGARALFDILGKQDTGLLGRLSSVLGGPQQKTIADQGTGMLGSLLGTSSLGSLVGAVSKFSGGNEQQSSGIVGMLAPIILGTLSQQQKSSGLDAAGIANFLAAQRTNIASMIPGDIAKSLSGTGLLDVVLPKSAASNGSTASGPITTAPAPVTAAFNGWPWAILVAAATFIWGALFSGPPAPWASIPAPPRIMAGTTDVAGELDVALKGFHTILSNVKDKTTADGALPQLRAAETTIGKLTDSTRQLSTNDRRAMAGYVSTWIPVLTDAVKGPLNNAAAGPVVKPTVEAILNRLTALVRI